MFLTNLSRSKNGKSFVFIINSYRRISNNYEIRIFSLQNCYLAFCLSKFIRLKIIDTEQKNNLIYSLLFMGMSQFLLSINDNRENIISKEYL